MDIEHIYRVGYVTKEKERDYDPMASEVICDAIEEYNKVGEKIKEMTVVLIEVQRLLKNGAGGAIVDTVWSDTAGNTTLYELIETVVNEDYSGK